MKNKPLKTIKETPKGRNVKSVNKKTQAIERNKELIKKVEAKKLPNYHVVKPVAKKKFLRSNPDRKKKNNLDPKISM